MTLTSTAKQHCCAALASAALRLGQDERFVLGSDLKLSAPRRQPWGLDPPRLPHRRTPAADGNRVAVAWGARWNTATAGWPRGGKERTHGCAEPRSLLRVALASATDLKQGSPYSLHTTIRTGFTTAQYNSLPRGPCLSRGNTRAMRIAWRSYGQSPG